MQSRIVIVLGLVLLVAYAQANSQCQTCGLTRGVDGCGCQVNLVRPVRPVRINPSQPRIVCTKVPGVDKLQPIGDVCSCGNSIVAPAYVPKQRCNVCQGRVPQPFNPYAFNGPLQPAPSALNNFEPEETGGEYDYVNQGGAYGSSSNYALDDYYNQYYSPQQPLAPADAVSLTLAYGLAQKAAINVPEERLAFGFRELPKEGAIVKQINDIPEERLYTVDRQIVELKPVQRGCGITVEQEAEQDLLQIQQDELDQLDAASPSGQAYLSYRDIGYAPERAQNQQFYVSRSEQASAYEDQAPASAIFRNDGFIPGRVIQTNPEEYLEDADVSDAYGSDEDVQSGYRVIGGSYGGSWGPNSFAGNAGRSGVLINRLSGGHGPSCGCGAH